MSIYWKGIFVVRSWLCLSSIMSDCDQAVPGGPAWASHSSHQRMAKSHKSTNYRRNIFSLVGLFDKPVQRVNNRFSLTTATYQFGEIQHFYHNITEDTWLLSPDSAQLDILNPLSLVFGNTQFIS